MSETIEDADHKLMLTLAVGCLARELQRTDLSDTGRAEYQKAFDIASGMLDKYWRPS